MRHATLRQLKVFEAVARLSSYSRAAEELHLSQPAVSTQVSKLAEHAGVGTEPSQGSDTGSNPVGTTNLSPDLPRSWRPS